MIDLYTWTTPNGRKVSIMLEEIGLPYRRDRRRHQRGTSSSSPSSSTISPNNKIPAIVDRDNGVAHDGIGRDPSLSRGQEAGSCWRSAGPRSGKPLEWLMMQMGSVGPMLGQAHHFLKFNKGKSEYAEKRYGDEARRIYGVLNKRLGDAEYLAGDYSIADIATWPWISRYEWQGIDWEPYPNLKRWYLRDRRAAGGAARLSRAEARESDSDTPELSRIERRGELANLGRRRAAAAAEDLRTELPPQRATVRERARGVGLRRVRRASPSRDTLRRIRRGVAC